MAENFFANMKRGLSLFLPEENGDSSRPIKSSEGFDLTPQEAKTSKAKNKTSGNLAISQTPSAIVNDTDSNLEVVFKCDMSTIIYYTNSLTPIIHIKGLNIETKTLEIFFK